MKDKTIALITALLGGSFGLHKFYLNETSKGILYLLLSWTFIPVVLTIIDVVKLSEMSKAQFDLKYNLGTTTTYRPTHSVEQLLSNIGSPFGKGATTKQVKVPSKSSTADEIYKLGQLMDKGLITFEEFERRKAMLLKSTA
ncbi:MAG: NINE protein [Thermonemataceae bacterium]